MCCQTDLKNSTSHGFECNSNLNNSIFFGFFFLFFYSKYIIQKQFKKKIKNTNTGTLGASC